MLNQAVLVNGDFIVNSHSKQIYDGELNFGCNAIVMVFLKARQSEVEGGTLYIDGCPSINEASMIIVAKLKKIVITRDAHDSDEMCALELLKERNIEVVINPDNLL